MGSGEVSVKFVTFTNPDHVRYNGACCDNLNFCVDHCDSYFKLCLTTLGSTTKCELGDLQTAELGKDDITFGNSLNAGVSNPVIYTFSKWQVRKWFNSLKPGTDEQFLLNKFFLDNCFCSSVWERTHSATRGIASPLKH